MTITPGQCKAAREMLSWQQSELAYDMGVSQADISLFEAGVEYHLKMTHISISR